MSQNPTRLLRNDGEEVERPVGDEYWNRFYCRDARDLSVIPDGVVDLVVTSPPYNAGIDYDSHDDTLPFEEYLAITDAVWRECYRVMKPGGRIAVNVAGVGRQPYIPLQHIITARMRSLGFLHRAEIIWNKGAAQSNSTAWGSWMSAKNPVLRDQHEYINVFSKDRFDKGVVGESSISRDEFLEYTVSMWTFSPTTTAKAGHPAPFPIELPSRLIKLYSYKGDLVLDPFMGSGTTCQAAEVLERCWIGVDKSQKYCDLALRNMNKTNRRFDFSQLSQAE